MSRMAEHKRRSRISYRLRKLVAREFWGLTVRRYSL